MRRRPPRIPRPTPVERADSPRTAALARQPHTAADFWHAVEAHGAPLVEPIDGDPGHAAVTFLWRGTDGTRAVLALPNDVFDPRDLTPNLMARVPGTDVWHVTLRMRTDWRATYSLCVDEGQGPAGLRGRSYAAWLRGQSRHDPFNRATLPRRWGGEPLSVVSLPDAPSQSAWERRADIPAGQIAVHTVRSAALANWRRVWAYTPAGYRAAGSEPGLGQADLPVVVLLDGEMWQPGLGVSVLLDNLIADGRIPPLVALMPDSLDDETRSYELACDDRFVAFLGDELLPWAAGRWPLTDDPARTVLAGQDLGGLMSAYAAFRAPDRFGNALVQSGAFWWPDGPDAQWLTDRIGRRTRRDVRFHLSAGLQDWVLLPANRRLRDVLRDKGYDVTYREVNGGHDYACWRDELAVGLVELLGGA